MKKKITFDGILSFLLVIAACIASYFIFQFKTLPSTWRIAAIAIIVLSTLLQIALTLKKIPTWAIWTRRVITVILATALAVTSFYITKNMWYLSDISLNKRARDRHGCDK
jgi:hypothetical protein